jgi:hypothetical protein
VVQLALQSVTAVGDLLLIGGLELEAELGQFVQLVVVGNRRLPPGRRLDRAGLAVAPEHGVGRALVQATADGH